MQRWINLVETFCNPAREDEYNDWYDNVHVPDILATPGFVRARRFVHKELRDGRGKYMAMYEIESDDIDATMRLRRERRAEETRRGRSSASRGDNFGFRLWLDVLFREFFVQTSPQGATGASGKWVNFVEQECTPGREAEYHDWYNNLHIPDILRTPGFVGARRYEIQEPRDGRGRYLAVYEIESDDIEATMKVRLARRNEEAKAGRSSANRPGMNRPVWRDVLWQQILDRREGK